MSADVASETSGDATPVALARKHTSLTAIEESEALHRDLAQLREEAGRGRRLAMLDYVEHLLAGRVPLPPLPPTEPERHRALGALRTNLLVSLGLSPFPRRTALRPRSLGIVRRDGHAVEKIVFQPRPGFLVPALLYLPAEAPPPLPAVVYASGHFVEEGVLALDSQRCCIGLAKLGFAVLAYEAMGQGERGPRWEEFRQRYLPMLEQSERVRGAFSQERDQTSQRKWMAWAWHCLCAEHGQLPPLLVGLSQLGLMVWESVRALDYLCSRKDIDTTRLGIMGASGGGQNAYYTAAVDPRVACTVSICYLPSLTEQIRLSRGTNWWGGGDLCDQVPLHLTYAEFADIGALILPRPLLFVVGQRDDGFPIAAARAEYARLAPLYDSVAAGRLRLTAVDEPHGLSLPMRQAAYGWLMRWLQGRGDGSPVPEPAATPEARHALGFQPMSRGTNLSCIRPLIRLTRHQANRHAQSRQQCVPPADMLPERIRSLLGVQLAASAQVTHVTSVPRAGLAGEQITIQIGPHIEVLIVLARANIPAPHSPLVLIVHDGEWDRVWDDGWVPRLLDRACAVAIVDTTGNGPEGLRTARPGDTVAALEEIITYRDDRGPFVTDFEVTSALLMLGRSLLGERVADLCGAIALLAARPDAPPTIRCLGIGQGGLVAILAAALEPRIEAVATWRSLLSFASLIVEEPAFSASTFPFGILRHFDLPDVLAALAPRPVTVALPCDGRGDPLSPEEAASTCEHPACAYARLGASDNWHILFGSPAQAQDEVCARLAGTHA